MSFPITLKDKICVITGSASGIGKAIAERYIADGAKVVIADLRLDAAQAPAAELTAKGRGTAIGVEMNVTDEAAVTFANRLPQLSFGMFRPLADADTAEGLTLAVTPIAASGEFIGAVHKGSGGLGGIQAQIGIAMQNPFYQNWQLNGRRNAIDPRRARGRVSQRPTDQQDRWIEVRMLRAKRFQPIQTAVKHLLLLGLRF